jgi:hypothetical protein
MQLDFNRERQRQLEGRCGGNSALLSPKDRRELDTLVREERTLIRSHRLLQTEDYPPSIQASGRLLSIPRWAFDVDFIAHDRY